MTKVGSIERVTQNRVVKLFQEELTIPIWEIGKSEKTIATLKKNS